MLRFINRPYLLQQVRVNGRLFLGINYLFIILLNQRSINLATDYFYLFIYLFLTIIIIIIFSQLCIVINSV